MLTQQTVKALKISVDFEVFFKINILNQKRMCTKQNAVHKQQKVN